MLDRKREIRHDGKLHRIARKRLERQQPLLGIVADFGEEAAVRRSAHGADIAALAVGQIDIGFAAVVADHPVARSVDLHLRRDAGGTFVTRSAVLRPGAHGSPRRIGHRREGFTAVEADDPAPLGIHAVDGLCVFDLRAIAYDDRATVAQFQPIPRSGSGTTYDDRRFVHQRIDADDLFVERRDVRLQCDQPLVQRLRVGPQVVEVVGTADRHETQRERQCKNSFHKIIGLVGY